MSPMGIAFVLMTSQEWLEWQYSHFGELKIEDKSFTYIDHLAFNVSPDMLDKCARWVTQHLEFKALPAYEIHGAKTGFKCSAFISTDEEISLVVNVSDMPDSQINTFMARHKGAGIQHLAFATQAICRTVKELRAAHLPFVSVPKAYYDELNVDIHTRNDIESLGILLDKAPQGSGFLKQIFTQEILGPLFFELIQRQNRQGFGEGNITALFKAVERGG